VQAVAVRRSKVKVIDLLHQTCHTWSTRNYHSNTAAPQIQVTRCKTEMHISHLIWQKA